MHGVIAKSLFFLFSSFAPPDTACAPPASLQADLRTLPAAQASGTLAYWFLEQKNLPCAIAAFRTAVKQDPAAFEIRYNLGAALAESGDLPGAAEQLRAAVRLKPGEPQAQSALQQVEQELAQQAARHQQQAARLLSAGDRPGAIAELRHALALQPASAEALGNLGVLLQQQGQPAEAERLFVRAIAANPRDPAHRLNLGLTLTELKRYTEAAAAMDQALALSPQNPAALTAKAMILLRQQQREPAIALFRQVLAAQPNSAQAHLNLGLALADAQRQAEALPSFDAALRLAPDLLPARFNRGRALYDLKRYDDARTDLAAVLARQPRDVATQYRLGLTLARLREPQPAADLLRQVVAAEPRNSIAQQELGQALLELGQAADGEKHLRTALQLDPHNSQAAYALMRVLSSRGSSEAAQLGQRVRQLKQDELAVTQARAFSNFGLDAAKQQNWPQAIENLRKAVDTCGACLIQPALRRNLGLILAQSGDRAGAIAELQAAQKLDPADQDVTYALDLLRRLKAKP